VSTGDETKTWPAATVVKRVMVGEDFAPDNQAVGNLDVGAYDVRGQTVTADGLSAGEVVFTGTNGVMSGEAGFAWDATNKLLTVTKTAIAATQGDYGLVLVNTTAAANGAQQWSPPIRWKGYGWETAVGSSDAVEFRSFVRPVQGTAVSGGLDFQASLNGGAYATVFTMLAGGLVGVNTGVPVEALTVNGAASTWSGGNIIYYNDAGITQYFQMGLSGAGGFQFQRFNAAAGGSFYIVSLAGAAKLALGFETGNLSIGTANVPSGGGAGVGTFAQTTDPTGIPANCAGIFAKDNGGTAQMYKFNESGTVSAIG
jgi:hypothetical protein